MTKQEWTEKFEKEFNGGNIHLHKVADFFYSLHLQEIEKIRERVKELGHQQEDDTIWCNMDDVLLAITDESHGTNN